MFLSYSTYIFIGDINIYKNRATLLLAFFFYAVPPPALLLIAEVFPNRFLLLLSRRSFLYCENKIYHSYQVMYISTVFPSIRRLVS
jgi:hypothetical protein